ncbi:MAG TPA: hypothetical protein PLO78_04850 [Candidatus Omnitrophota bacterium]|nr:hypothetical protein [Candidatus Omnitrophota bacterium]
MKAFWVGLLVLVMVIVLSGIGILLLPLFLVLGIFLRLVVGLFVLIFVIWAVGQVTLLLIELLSAKPK